MDRFKVPIVDATVKPTAPSSQYHRGVLTVRLPKAEARSVQSISVS